MSENDNIGRSPTAVGETRDMTDKARATLDRKVSGASTAAKDGVRKASAVAHKAIDGAAQKLNAGVGVASDRTRAAYDRAAVGVKKVADTVDPFVTERPYASLGIGLGVGVVLGLLLAGRGPRVIYVNPRD